MGNLFTWLMNLFGDPDQNESYTSSVVHYTNVNASNSNSNSNIYQMANTYTNYLDYATKLITGHEGLRLKVYKDNDGSDTIGYGQHLSSLTHDQEVYLMFNYHVTAGNLDSYLHNHGIQPNVAFHLTELAVTQLDKTLHNEWPDWYSTLNQHRQAVLLDMTYNLGLGVKSGKHGILSLVTFLHYIEQHSWEAAAHALSISAYARQLPSREENNMKILVEG